MTALLRLPARLLRRHRRGAAALLAGLAMFCLAQSLRPAAPPTVPVLVAARDLAAGITLTADDLVVRQLPPDVAPPAGLTTATTVLGRVLTGPVDAGVAVTARSVVGPALAVSSEGRVLAPVRLPDPDLAALLAPGTRVDLVAASESGKGAVVASGARVVTLPAPGSGGGGPLGGASDTRGLLVILEVTPAEATAIAQAAAGSRLSVALR